MIDPGAIAQLVQAGGWTLFVFTVFSLAIAVHRQLLVPGWVYRREVAHADDLSKSLKTLTAAFRRLAAKAPKKPDA